MDDNKGQDSQKTGALKDVKNNYEFEVAVSLKNAVSSSTSYL